MPAPAAPAPADPLLACRMLRKPHNRPIRVACWSAGGAPAQDYFCFHESLTMRHAVHLYSITLVVLLLAVTFAAPLSAQTVLNDKYGQRDKFRQLDEILPTPNDYRTASGAPGHRYWQQQADYEIDVTLDDQKQILTGQETITYYNNSPDTLKYIWLQLDPNLKSLRSGNRLTTPSPELQSGLSYLSFEQLLTAETFDGGVTVSAVSTAAGDPLRWTVVTTNMRIDLPQPLAPGEKFRFSVGWSYQVPDARVSPGRTACEFFEKDGNYLYEIAQWFPRMCAYSDATGWQNKEYLGRGEFALEFGDYKVRITVPEDHIVAATGVLQNPDQVLTEQQRNRLNQAREATEPMFIVTPEEALASQKEAASGSRTWEFHAENVRDFAFASSRKFIWDAVGHDVGGQRVMAMSYYPNEGEPLWSRYSTQAIVHTLDVYSRYTFDYPYPTAISVNGPVGGMEYPMICFNGPRPEADGTYSDRTKYGLITVIIHEVGHNYFPMIVNSDERQWTWMDEGLNTFLQYLAEVEWEDDYPSRRGEPRLITGYMTSTGQVPIMTNSESILQVGNNAYGKPATALNILRETVLGRELFDFAFQEFSRRWMFRRPEPADLFRTMEDASGVDLDWFWYGWFYSTDHVDIAVTAVHQYQVSNGNPDEEATRSKEKRDSRPRTLSEQRNQELTKRANLYPVLKDFYNSYDELDVTDEDRKAFEKRLDNLSEPERQLLGNQQFFHLIDLENRGGLVMPVILKLTFDDDTTSEVRFPAEVWVRNSRAVTKLVITEKPVVSVEVDPHLETADADRSNNHFPPVIQKSRFRLFKDQKSRNPMQKAGLGKTEEKSEQEESE